MKRVIHVSVAIEADDETKDQEVMDVVQGLSRALERRKRRAVFVWLVRWGTQGLEEPGPPEPPPPAPAAPTPDRRSN